MPSVKISQLPKVTSTDGGELFLVIQSGISKNIPLNELFDGLISSKSFDFNVGAGNLVGGGAKAFIISNDDSTLFYAASNKVGIGTNNPLQTLHVNGSAKIGNSPSSFTTSESAPALTDGVLITPYEMHYYSGSAPNNNTSINPSVDTTLISIISDSTFSLGAGIPGQVKNVTLYATQGGAKATISPGLGLKLGFQNVILQAVGSNVTLKFIASSWIITSVFNASVNY